MRIERTASSRTLNAAVLHSAVFLIFGMRRITADHNSPQDRGVAAARQQT
jgi:hypothetical protein